MAFDSLVAGASPAEVYPCAGATLTRYWLVVTEMWWHGTCMVLHGR